MSKQQSITSKRPVTSVTPHSSDTITTETIIVVSVMIAFAILSLFSVLTTIKSYYIAHANSAVVKTLTPQEYQNQFAHSNTLHFLLDVRQPEEFSTGHIDGSANISVQTLTKNLALVPRDLPVIVYCHSGGCSTRAAQILKNAGYTQIYDLGGIIDWQAAGYPIE